ncbi:hypothetical protein M4914_23500 [Streptomyces somaliensis DSM 40738]|uniref:hypothetical protein n=1 Tax=Streptomyces somaliensis TaxID=78355 RepID=UPI0021C3A407|nr:hypothetical protein [Streptomyces somaliensis]MCQ0025610.1 hypothetical protein [Streptomyces somaliensis DSM 40738]
MSEEWATLHGGPLDGECVPVDPAGLEPGVAMVASGCAIPGGRSWYEPDETGRWRWIGDTP